MAWARGPVSFYSLGTGRDEPETIGNRALSPACLLLAASGSPGSCLQPLPPPLALHSMCTHIHTQSFQSPQGFPPPFNSRNLCSLHTSAVCLGWILEDAGSQPSCSTMSAQGPEIFFSFNIFSAIHYSSELQVTWKIILPVFFPKSHSGISVMIVSPPLVNLWRRKMFMICNAAVWPSSAWLGISKHYFVSLHKFYHFIHTGLTHVLWRVF